jgi:hypothetical protein
MSLETAQKVIVPQKKNYVPHFLKQRDINSYFSELTLGICVTFSTDALATVIRCQDICIVFLIPSELRVQ